MSKARYRIYSSVILDASIDDVWREMRDFTRALKIAFADGITDIHWVDGGSPDKVPSRIAFALMPGGVQALEEVVARSELDRTLTYRNLGTVMSIEDYVGSFQFRTITDEPARTFFEANKEFGLTEGTDVDAFLRMYNALVDQETKNVKAYFASSAANRAKPPMISSM